MISSRHRIGRAAWRGFLLGLPLMCAGAAWVAVDADRDAWQAFLATDRRDVLVGEPWENPYLHLRALGRWERQERELPRSGQRVRVWRARLDGRDLLFIRLPHAK